MVQAPTVPFCIIKLGAHYILEASVLQIETPGGFAADQAVSKQFTTLPQLRSKIATLGLPFLYTPWLQQNSQQQTYRSA